MREGHTFTIEPVVVEGKTSFSIWPDKWTAVSKVCEDERDYVCLFDPCLSDFLLL